jgi:aryl-alcohol dehydrogenase-like predicted oxidoreductase
MAQLSMGTMNFGRRTPEAEARRIIARALECGLRSFDTANLYSDGEAERVLGRALVGRRGEVQLTTKVGAWKNEGLSRARVVASLDESLTRLGTDFVDVFLLHAPDPKTPLEETLEGVREVLGAGKARAWGVSNFAAWQLGELNHLCASAGLVKPSHSQVLYNLAVRQLEVEYVPFTQRFPLRTSVFNPLAGGLFARDPSQPRPKQARLEANGLYRRRYGSAVLLEFARAVNQVATDAGYSLVHVAFGFVLSRPWVHEVLAGPATLEHLNAAIAATAPLPPELVAALDEVHRARLGTDASYAR